jgi:iron complex transport system substrate-binding protein
MSAQRIVCLTAESTEFLYLLGEQHRIVGISGFTVRPPEARREKPRVAAFTSAKIEQILALKPDLVIGFSDLQAPIAAQLVSAGLEIHIFNQRSLAQIMEFMRMLGAMVGAQRRTAALIRGFEAGMKSVRAAAKRLPRRPRVYFEEWNQPMICGIHWVSELITLAGGEDCFADLAQQPNARARIIADPLEVVRRAPELIIGSWCGKKFRAQHVRARAGWSAIPAVRSGQLCEIKSCDILAPGPAALTDGLRQLQTLIANCASILPPLEECSAEQQIEQTHRRQRQ